MEKASIKFTFLTLFVIAIAVAVVPVPKVEARELQQTSRIPIVMEVEAKEPRQPLSMPVAKMEAKELPKLTLSVQPNQLCLLCSSNADCNVIWSHCRDGCCQLF
uniref:Jasmintide 14 n=1 Tax=Jasminum sambac TaxID=660624 RepID=A0A2K9QL67_9LAMI|nr:jasmintide 14 precursor [Jasminum sambac]